MGNKRNTRARDGQTPARPGSLDGLNASDPGIAMLSAAMVDVEPSSIAMLYTGDIPGVAAPATRWALDVRELASAQASTVCVGVEQPSAAGRFQHSLIWPRAHLGKDFAIRTVALAATITSPGGYVWCASKKRKGAESLMDFMGTVMGNVHIVQRAKGYRLARSDRFDVLDTAAIREQLDRRYEISHPLLGDATLHSGPGVFSRKELDAGTQCLLEHISEMELRAPRVIDLGAGVGPICAWWAKRNPKSRVLAVDSNVIAADLCRSNMRRLDLHERVTVCASDGLPNPAPPPWTHAKGKVDLALSNPPTHADAETLRRLFVDLRAWLRPGAPAVFVASRAAGVVSTLQATGATVETHDYPRFAVIEARWPAPGQLEQV